jgi:Tol biopolymer transport system component
MLNLTDLLRVPQVDTGLRFDISPDGQRVAFAWNQTGKWEIYELDLSEQGNHEANLITHGDGAKFSPQYSPNGKQLAYALDLDGSESYHIVLHDLKTASSIDLTPSSGYAHQPNFAFSPDGKSLAILSDERGQFALYLLFIETGENKLLLDLQRPIWDVSWSPDGNWIAAEAEMHASDRGLFVVEVETGKYEQIKANGAALNAQHPAWSVDSKILAFSAESGEWFDIGLYYMETGETHWLTQGPGDDTSPNWSQDGNRICWLHSDGAVNSFFFYESGYPVQQFLVSSGIHHQPQFSTEGEILFLFESPS